MRIPFPSPSPGLMYSSQSGSSSLRLRSEFQLPLRSFVAEYVETSQVMQMLVKCPLSVFIVRSPKTVNNWPFCLAMLSMMFSCTFSKPISVQDLVKINPEGEGFCVCVCDD